MPRTTETDKHPFDNECIVCGERIPYHHACIVIPISLDYYCKYAHIQCQEGINKALKEKRQE